MSVISLSRSNSSHHTYGQAPRNPALPTTRHGATRKQSFLKLALMGRIPGTLQSPAQSGDNNDAIKSCGADTSVE